MLASELRIVLDRTKPVYTAGETITGHVEVHPSNSCDCRALVLRCSWRTKSDGATDDGEIAAQVLFTGAWQAGKVYTYPFSIVVPNGPFSYHGRLFDVQWCLKAHARLVSARDLRKEATFSLVPGPLAGTAHHGPKHTFEAHARYDRKSKHLLGPAGVLLTGLGTAMLYNAEITCCLSAHAFFLRTGVAGAMDLAGIFLIYFAMRSWIARRKIGPVAVNLSEAACTPGNHLTCSLRFKPKAALELNHITATLVGEETLILDEGDNARTITRVIHREEIRLGNAQRLEARRDVHHIARFFLPADAPYTFLARNHELAWTLRVHIDLARRPDWTYVHPITVTPVARQHVLHVSSGIPMKAAA